MKSHELMRELLQHANAKQLAAAMGLSASMIYKWAEPSTAGGSGTPNPLDRVEQLARHTDGPRVAQWVCERANGYYVKNPGVKSDQHEQSLVTATHGIVQEFADMISAIATAATDNSITDAEASAIRTRWQQLKSETEEFVCCCEKGDFGLLRRSSSPAKVGVKV
jgi:hypothetical protein